MHDRHDYIGTPAKAPMHPLLHALIKLAILYVAVYAICFAVEGAMRSRRRWSSGKRKSTR